MIDARFRSMWHTYFQRRSKGLSEPVPARGEDRWTVHAWVLLAVATVLLGWSLW